MDCGGKSLFSYCRHGEVRAGALVGEDYLGNKYYENNDYFFGEKKIGPLDSLS